MSIRKIKRRTVANLLNTELVSLRFDGALCALLRGMSNAERERFILAALKGAT